MTSSKTSDKQIKGLSKRLAHIEGEIQRLSKDDVIALEGKESEYLTLLKEKKGFLKNFKCFNSQKEDLLKKLDIKNLKDVSETRSELDAVEKGLQWAKLKLQANQMFLKELIPNNGELLMNHIKERRGLLKQINKLKSDFSKVVHNQIIMDDIYDNNTNSSSSKPITNNVDEVKTLPHQASIISVSSKRNIIEIDVDETSSSYVTKKQRPTEESEQIAYLKQEIDTLKHWLCMGTSPRHPLHNEIIKVRSNIINAVIELNTWTTRVAEQTKQLNQLTEEVNISCTKQDLLKIEELKDSLQNSTKRMNDKIIYIQRLKNRHGGSFINLNNVTEDVPLLRLSRLEKEYKLLLEKQNVAMGDRLIEDNSESSNAVVSNDVVDVENIITSNNTDDLTDNADDDDVIDYEHYVEGSVSEPMSSGISKVSRDVNESDIYTTNSVNTNNDTTVISDAEIKTESNYPSSLLCNDVRYDFSDHLYNSFNDNGMSIISDFQIKQELCFGSKNNSTTKTLNLYNEVENDYNNNSNYSLNEDILGDESDDDI